MKIKLFSRTWAGTEVKEIIDLEEWGIEVDTIEEIEEDKQLTNKLFEVALKQQHFDWGVFRSR